MCEAAAEAEVEWRSVREQARARVREGKMQARAHAGVASGRREGIGRAVGGRGRAWEGVGKPWEGVWEGGEGVEM